MELNLNMPELAGYTFGAYMASVYYNYTGLCIDKMVAADAEQAARDMQKIANACIGDLEKGIGQPLGQIRAAEEVEQKSVSDNGWWFLDVKEWQKLDFKKLDDYDEINSREVQLFFTAMKTSVAAIAFVIFTKIGEPFFQKKLG